MKKNILPSLFCLIFLGFSILLRSQEVKIQVFGPESIPLEGAVINGLPQNWSVYTDANGTAIVPPADTLIVSYLGMETRKLTWRKLRSQGQEVYLTSAGVALPEIVVGSSQLRRDLSQEKKSISALAIQQAQVSTPAEALAVEAGAFVQMSQLGGGSPVLRGFEANRVLLVVDGIRMNNAIYRSGHLQNAITIDENVLRKIDVSYGAGALAYGSDALGGVIHFYTKNPLPTGSSTARWSGRTGLRVSTATAEQSALGELIYQGERWSSLTAITASRFGDLRTGRNRPDKYPDFGKRSNFVTWENGQDIVVPNNDPDLQVGSGYEQLDVLQKINYQAGRALRLQLNLQHSTSGEVPRYDALTETRNGQLRFAEWYYGPQNRSLVSLNLNWQLAQRWADEIRIKLAHQVIDEDRFDRRLGDPWREESRVRVNASNLTADIQKKVSLQNLLQYGVLIRYDQVMSSARRISVEDGEVRRDVNSRYPSQQSNLQAADAYFQYQYYSADSTFLAEAGGRLSSQRLYAQFGANDPIAWPDFYLNGITNNNWALNGAAGFTWRQQGWQFRTHLATGFRAPNIDDFAKFRENDGFVQIPNPTLVPEKSRALDLSIGYHWSRNNRVQLTAYRTWLRDAMIRENYQLPDGASFFLDRSDTLFVQAIVNAEQASVWGLSLAYHHQLHTNWELEGQLHYTAGRRVLKGPAGISLEVPLDHIPPIYGQVRLAYRNGPWEAATQWQFQGKKAVENYAVAGFTVQNNEIIYNRLGTADNLELTPTTSNGQAFAGSYAWWVINLRASYRIGQTLRLRVNINNLFDLHYRTFSSGISAPGRNLVFGVYKVF